MPNAYAVNDECTTGVQHDYSTSFIPLTIVMVGMHNSVSATLQSHFTIMYVTGFAKGIMYTHLIL